MAQKAKGVKIRLVCSECKHINYTTTKSGGVNSKIQTKKYCKWCKKHTLHTETSVSKR